MFWSPDLLLRSTTLSFLICDRTKYDDNDDDDGDGDSDNDGGYRRVEV